MQQLNLDENNIIAPKENFWRRQFQSEMTESPRKFDWFFGVILPVICFVFDPIVFKNNGVGATLLGSYKPFAYLLSFVSVMAMSAWLIWGAKLKWLNAFLAGLFAVGGIISFGIGLILFPFSLIGLIILIGALGFTPLLSAIVFLRNAVRAFHAAKPFLEKRTLIYSAALCAIFSFVVPITVNFEIKRSLENIKNGDEQTILTEARKLRYVAPLVNFDDLALSYFHSMRDEKANGKMRAIAEFYKDMTGKDIETKARVLMD